MTGNRKSMAIILVMFCITALTAFVTIAQADTGGCNGEHEGKRQQHDFRKIAKKLGMTDAQKAQAKAIFTANKEVVKPIITNLRAERKNLRDLMQADTIDDAAIRAETAKIAAIQADLNVNRAKINAQFRAILTPAQLATLKTLPQKRHNKREFDDTPPLPAPGN